MREKEEMELKTETESASQEAGQSVPPMGFKILIREFKR